MKTRTIAALAAAALAVAPGFAYAATGGASHHAASPPKPVAVYVGRRLIASGQSLSKAVSLVRSQVPFAIQTPRYVPSSFIPVQLAVTPQQRDVSGGRTTLSYVLANHGKVPQETSNGFVIEQMATPPVYVRSTRTITVTVGHSPATLDEFKAPGHDILILRGINAKGNGYDIVTDAALSRLSISTLVRIAASLH